MLLPLGAWCPSGEREERRTGTKLIAVFQQHICTEVNTLKGVVEALTGILESVLFMRTNAASSGLYGSRGGVGRSKKISEAQHVVD